MSPHSLVQFVPTTSTHGAHQIVEYIKLRRISRPYQIGIKSRPKRIQITFGRVGKCGSLRLYIAELAPQSTRSVKGVSPPFLHPAVRHECLPRCHSFRSSGYEPLCSLTRSPLRKATGNLVEKRRLVKKTALLPLRLQRTSWYFARSSRAAFTSGGPKRRTSCQTCLLWPSSATQAAYTPHTRQQGICRRLVRRTHANRASAGGLCAAYTPTGRVQLQLPELPASFGPLGFYSHQGHTPFRCRLPTFATHRSTHECKPTHLFYVPRAVRVRIGVA